MTTETREIRYFEDWDTCDFFACVERHAAREGLFRLRVPVTPDSQWEFLVPHTSHWDMVHQTLFFTGKATPVAVAALPAGLPPVPAVPPGPFPTPAQQALPAEPIPVERYPRLACKLLAQPVPSAQVVVLLKEDRYETLYGDGCFRYFDSAYFEAAAAARHASLHTAEFMCFHTRQLAVKIAGGCYAFPDFDLEVFDRYRPVEVLEALERGLPTQAV
jgi:hypothetical protein